MPTTDINKIISNLKKFCTLDDKVILCVGAGGGQFVVYGRDARKVIAIDSDPEALKILETRVEEEGLKEKFEIILKDFGKCNIHADLVIFEFSLHEMRNPCAAIRRALTLAPEVVIMDHWKSSSWAFLIDEYDKITRSWNAVETFIVKNLKVYDSMQNFADYDQLNRKIESQGETAIERAKDYKNRKNFTIPFSYAFALIAKSDNQ